MSQAPLITKLRVTVLLTVVLSMMTALVLRLYYLQILNAHHYTEAADVNSVRFIPIEPTRGRILDRKGRELITNRASNVVSIRPDALRNRSGTIARLGQVLALTPEQIESRLADKRAQPFLPIPIANDVPEDAVVFIREHNEQFPGVETERTAVRVYPMGGLAAHVLGYTGEITEDQLHQEKYQKPYKYRPGAVVGRTGAEYAYEQDLRGKDGVIEELVNAKGEVIDEDVLTRKLNSIEETPGKDVVLTLDSDVQRLVEESLAQGIQRSRTLWDDVRLKHFVAPGGAALVLDPRNGEVLAMASWPNYQPSDFSGGISRKQFDALNHDPAKPLLNRATQAEFPPGSTFKIVTATAALEEGVAARGRRYPCPAQVRFFNQTFRNWRAGDSGALTVSEALQDSCNTVFQLFGRDFYERYKRGQGEKLQEYARRFGFGLRTGIELPSERDGRVPDTAWLKTMHQRLPKAFPYSEWLPGYTINLSFGQGDLNVTPLQLATAYSAIANGGTVLRPHVGLKIMEGDKEARVIGAQETGKVPVSPANLQAIRQGLESVPTQGTAAGVFAGSPVMPFGVAAKTGSAQLQTIPPSQPFSWFAAYAPAAAPQYVVVAMVEQGGAGSQSAAPIVRRILEGLFGFPVAELGPSPKTE